MNRTAYVIDGDTHSACGISDILRGSGICVKYFQYASDFIAFKRSDDNACLLSELHLPDMHGLELQLMLAGRDAPPIVFMTAQGDVRCCVRAMKQGAVEILTKPFLEEQLLEAVESAFERDLALRREQTQRSALAKRWISLTQRESEVFQFVVAGYLNKQAAAELQIAENTFQVHRGRVMKKMKAASLADLVRMSMQLEQHTRTYCVG